VVQASEGHAQALPCTVGQLIALTRRAAVTIGGDTGPLHLAAALERPVVGIYGPTDPARNGPYGTRSRVLRDASSATSHKRVSEVEAGMLRIGVEEVLAAAMEMLG
jgi:heptosyltransferase-1